MRAVVSALAIKFNVSMGLCRSKLLFRISFDNSGKHLCCHQKTRPRKRKLKLLKFRFKPCDKSCCLENLISWYYTRRGWQVHEMLMWKCTIPSRHERDEFQSRFLIKNVFWNSTWLNYSSSFSTPNYQRHAIHHFSKLLHHEQLHKQLETFGERLRPESFVLFASCAVFK